MNWTYIPIGWAYIMLPLGIALGYLIGWAQYRRRLLRQVFWTHTPDAYLPGSVANGWRVISLDREPDTKLADGRTLPFWRVTAEAAE